MVTELRSIGQSIVYFVAEQDVSRVNLCFGPCYRSAAFNKKNWLSLWGSVIVGWPHASICYSAIGYNCMQLKSKDIFFGELISFIHDRFFVAEQRLLFANAMFVWHVSDPRKNADIIVS